MAAGNQRKHLTLTFPMEVTALLFLLLKHTCIHMFPNTFKKTKGFKRRPLLKHDSFATPFLRCHVWQKS